MKEIPIEAAQSPLLFAPVSTVLPTQAPVWLAKVPVLKVPELAWDVEELSRKNSDGTMAGDSWRINGAGLGRGTKTPHGDTLSPLYRRL